MSNWRPIEEAPRDGTTVLLWAEHWRSPLTGWAYGSDDWQDCRKDTPDRPPTHFMPLPDPPPPPKGSIKAEDWMPVSNLTR